MTQGQLVITSRKFDSWLAQIAYVAVNAESGEPISVFLMFGHFTDFHQTHMRTKGPNLKSIVNAVIAILGLAVSNLALAQGGPSTLRGDPPAAI